MAVEKLPLAFRKYFLRLLKGLFVYNRRMRVLDVKLSSLPSVLQLTSWQRIRNFMQ